MQTKQKTKAVTLSLTKNEEQDLINISEKFFGTSNKSGMVRYWITQNNLKNCKSEGKIMASLHRR